LEDTLGSYAERQAEQMKFIRNVLLYTIPAIFLIVAVYSSAGWNDSTEQTVTQNIFGSVQVHNTSGPWFSLLAKSKVFPKSDSFYFSSKDDEGEDYDDAVVVSFKNSSGGSVSGSVRFTYPLNEDKMVQIFSKYGSPASVKMDLVRNVVRNIVTMNASMMSPEAAMSQKGKFQQDFLDQLVRGQYVTQIVTEVVTDPVSEDTKTTEVVSPVVDEATGAIKRLPNAAGDMGIGFDTVTVTTIEVDDKTRTLIDQRRDAEMKVIVARADQERAEQEKQKVTAEGQKSVEEAKYAALMIKETETVNADRVKEVATIGAAQRVAVAELDKNEQAIKLETAA